MDEGRWMKDELESLCSVYLFEMIFGMDFNAFNKNFLMMQGMSEEDIEKIEKDPLQAPLEDKERDMLAFVMKAIESPDGVEKADIDHLHDQGWTDNDILDALTHGTNMIGSSILMKAFKMDQTC